MWESFRTRVPGKWVIVGEHTVLRGGSAVALPHPEFGLELTFQPQVWEGLSVIPEKATQVIESIFSEYRKLRPEFQDPRGTLQITSTIPIGAGLGSSAALCVAMTDWLAHGARLSNEERRATSTALEHGFHGRSSGMDVAAIVSNGPIEFSMKGGPRPLQIQKLPKFTFHDTGIRAATRACIEKVAVFREKSPVEAQLVDQRMTEAARLAVRALESGDLNQLADAIQRGHECFETWGLVPDSARHQASNLLKEGALAVKLTGAGAGGFLVALWR